mmetsp:Transcript_23173/g.70982  ORF Transcript_23173/g.70982 Transcript_23173/m.70982 type:complete len:150 (+) Transcript_23173:632-1081(+)
MLLQFKWFTAEGFARAHSWRWWRMRFKLHQVVGQRSCLDMPAIHTALSHGTVCRTMKQRSNDAHERRDACLALYWTRLKKSLMPSTRSAMPAQILKGRAATRSGWRPTSTKLPAVGAFRAQALFGCGLVSRARLHLYIARLHTLTLRAL